MVAKIGAGIAVRGSILITSAGRRGKLVSLFRQEVETLLPGSEVFAADLRPHLSVACQLAHASFAVPPVSDPAYASELLALCSAHDIRLIVPTIDPELAVLAAHREAFLSRGVTPVVSNNDFVRVCRDKRLTSDWFGLRGLRVPAVVDPRTTDTFPLFAKPFDGSCSANTHVIHQRSDLTPRLLEDPRLVFVEYLSPKDYAEYTIDLYYDRFGQLKCIVPRLRLETRAGEVSKGQTARIAAMKILRDRMGTIAGARGCVTLQVFVGRRSDELFAIEINPRFGGGYPLSYDAGANFPRWLIEEYLLDKPVEAFDDWEDNLTMLRYDDHVVVRASVA